MGHGDSKGWRSEAQLETGEEGGIPPQAELHDLPQGARLHGKARISARFSRSGETAAVPGELEELIGNRDYKEFLNSRNKLYRKKKMKLRPPSRREAIRMMAKEPNLIRRPVVVAGGRIVLGFDKDGIARL